MKKTLVTFSVFLTVVCCTLAYATNRQGSLAFFENTSTPDKEQKSITNDEETSVKSIVKYGLQLSQKEINRATSRLPFTESKKMMKAAVSNGDSTGTVVVDLWNTATDIQTLNEGGNFDAATNTISFPGSSTTSNQIFTNVINGTNYGWYAMDDCIYHFSGTLTSDGNATVYPCIVYFNGNEYFIANNSVLELNETNGFTSDFYVESTGIQAGYPILVAFVVENSSSETTIKSTNNQFYYAYNSLIAEEWNAESGVPGLGLEGFEHGTYVVTCEDGVTTLGLYYDGSLYVTGIKTTASEVVLPKNITIGDNVEYIDYLGHGNIVMNWEGAPNLTSLDASSVNQLNVSFNNSAITDLYIGQNTNFFNNPSGVENIYLHIPYGLDKKSYNSYGFKRVLVGDEQPHYPVSSVSDWVIAGERDGDYFGISTYDGYFVIKEIFTDKDSVELPIGTPAWGGTYYVRYLGNDENYSSSVLCQNAKALKSVIIPSSYTNLCVNWSYTPIKDLHMQGDVPGTYWNLKSDMTVYVRDKSYFANYQNSSNWYNATIVPEGWDFDWMTVNVGRKGEFAQTYIEMTDADWAKGINVKVTGELNESDLNNMKKLTALRKLDLSEAVFDKLTDFFMSDNTTLLEVTLPGSLNEISRYAFSSCAFLQKVTAPGVLSIQDAAFQHCENLTDFDISGVVQIGSSAFSYCRKYNPTLPAGLTTLNSLAFYGTAINEVVLPQSITVLSNKVFANCKQLTKVTIPQSITVLSNEVFANCEKLTKVTLPSTLTAIGNSCFSNCSALTDINLPEGLNTMQGSVFSGCSALTEITLPSTLQEIGYDVFYNCSALKTVKCKAVVPPLAEGDIAGGVNMDYCTLYVAPFALDAYRDAKGWGSFYIMKPLNEPVKNILVERPVSFDLQSADDAILQDNPNLTLSVDLDQGGYYLSAGELLASGDGTLSAGVFKINQKFGRRDNSMGRSYADYRPTLINNAENMRADSVVCHIELEKNYWHFISFQYDVQMADIQGWKNTDFVIREYNSQKRAAGESNNWEPVPADGVLKAGKGYIIQAANNQTENGNYVEAAVIFPSRNTVTKNNLFTPNNIAVTLEEHPAEFAHNRSWNLVGNPYPCYFDLRHLMNDFMTPIVLWRGSTYQAYSPIDDDVILRPNEAFFVQKPLDTDQMVFGASGRMHFSAAIDSSQNLTPGIYNEGAAQGNAARAVFNFNIEGGKLNDRARIVMNEEASMDYEMNRDAAKFFATEAVGAEIYVDGSVKYDICERPLGEGVAILGMRVGKAGQYTLSLSGRNTAGWTVMLTDTQTGTTVNLTETDYHFSAESGTAAERFVLTFENSLVSGVDAVETDAANENVRVVNTAGITVFTGKLNDFKATAPMGVYIVVEAGKAYKMMVK